MRISLSPTPSLPAPRAGPASPAALALGASPRQLAQRARLQGAIGTGRARAAAPLQRVLAAQHDPASVALPPGADHKLQEVIALTNAMGAHIAPALTVKLRIDPREDHDPCPAYTHAAGNTLHVSIAAWFVKLASVGDLAGMLAHEIGVHTLADQLMTAPEDHAEQVNEVQDFSQRVGMFTHTVEGWAHPGQAWDPQGRQRDHTNVVRDDGSGAAPAKRRTAVYVETSLRLADAAVLRYAAHPAQQVQAVRDILQSFLFDYARILVTNDGKALRIFSAAHYIGDVFNWYRDIVVARHAHQYAWLQRPELLPGAGGWRLRAYLLEKLARMLAVRLNDSRLGRSPVGSLARGAAGAVNTLAIAPTRAVAGLPGVRHALGAAGHVAGFGLRWTEAGLKAGFGATWWLAKTLYAAVHR